ncbi:MAG: hypothetical protein ACOVNZ_10490, partial [Crocinitomicaceae bacterium]
MSSSERHIRNNVFSFETEKQLNANSTSNQIQKIKILDENGNTHEYGLPVYNYIEKNFTISLNPLTSPAIAKTFVNATDFSKKNNNGKNKVYTESVQPKYAQSYMLTNIKTPDYVDVNQNGIMDDDDFGDYFKFEYQGWDNIDPSSSSRFKWRSPLMAGASATQIPVSANIGNLSNPNDDIGNASYGEKDITYLSKIISKTHYAVFVLEDRLDGQPVLDETGTIDNNKFQKKLVRIDLFSFADQSKPVKSVHFEYSYELCRGVPNSKFDAAINPNQGKLTLKKVYFTYGGKKTKSTRNAYEFTYNTKDIDGNEVGYLDAREDAWGNLDLYSRYRKYAGIFTLTDQYQTTEEGNQFQKSEEMRINEAGMWSINKVSLPSGGTIL